jgi:O-antigen ligase
MLIPSRVPRQVLQAEANTAAVSVAQSHFQRPRVAEVGNVTIGLVQRFLLALIVFDIPFHFDVNLAYDTRMAELNAFGGLEVSLTTLSVFGLYALWFVEFALRRFSVVPAICFTSRWLALYTLIVVLSALYAPRRDLAIFQIVMYLQSFLIYFFVIKKVRSRGDILFIATSLISSVLLHSLLMIGLVGAGQAVQFGPWNAHIDGLRVGGTIGHPNSAANFLELLLPLCLGMFLASTQRWRKLLAMAAFSTGSLALILTFSRGGWLAGVASLGFFCICAWHRGWLSLRLPLALGICLLIAAIPFSVAISDSVTGKDRATAEGRFAMIELARHIIADSPVLGVGANNYAVVMGDYIRHPEFTGAWLHVVHNRYLLVWSETGVLGLIALVGFLISTVILGWQSFKSRHALHAALGLGLTAGILGQMLHMHLDLVGSRPLVQLLWIVCGLVASINALARRLPDSSDDSSGSSFSLGGIQQ